ncbi:galectin-4-like [Argiope bruennichi]|uniref:galectin-4-like n=1 Tax=Argiope bruennichi TaxID=94029 RepID=UPI002494F322|nr:galectin-4-like [Argiope bruennichi]
MAWVEKSSFLISKLEEGEIPPSVPQFAPTRVTSRSYVITFCDITPARPSLPPVYNPNIPYAYPIYGGLYPGLTIYITGRPSLNPHKFTINLQKGAAQYPPPDVAFHFDPRFFNRSVVRNTRSSGVWASEETYISHFPFQPGVSFDLVIRVEADRYSVSLNGQHFTDFRHRLRPLEIFDTLYIENDVSISAIRFS